jgi:hypothetical protein
MSDRGIDYGLGRNNIDKKTGCRYGVISLDSLSEFAIEDFESYYGDPTCPECGNAVTEYSEFWSEHPEEDEGDYDNHQQHSCSDYVCLDCKHILGSDEVYPDEPIGQDYEGEDYKLSLDSSNDVWVFHSPYYTHAQFCSPCAPGAGHLDHPCEDGPKTLCLGHDWFEGDQAPYPVFDVKTDERIYSKKEKCEILNMNLETPDEILQDAWKDYTETGEKP